MTRNSRTIAWNHNANTGYGMPGVLSQVYLEGTCPESYPDKSADKELLQASFK
jgi:hypothetical protein